MMKFLEQTKKHQLLLSASGKRTLKWHVDAAFTVHSDFKSHKGRVMTMGEGARSHTEAELVAADHTMSSTLWKRQGYHMKENVFFRIVKLPCY
jgi:hypothetical protein